MENIKGLKNLITQVERDLKSIQEMRILNDVSKMERQCLDGIRLLQLNSNKVFQDLYNICQSQRLAIKRGEVKKPVKKKKTTKKKKK